MITESPVPTQTTGRVTIPALEAILGQAIPVLDDGFVRLVDYMGGDESIVQAARVSYGAGTKSFREDRGLIRYLLRHAHTTPFEMCDIKLHVRVPMDTWRQWVRHRTASVNEYSTRYSVAIDRAQQTAPDAWRRQDLGNRQGSNGVLETEIGAQLSAEEQQLQSAIQAAYDRRLELGVAREQARKDLPLSTYTEAYWKLNLHNLLHFLRLRMDSHAQLEIRQYATTIGEQIVAKWVPMAWEAFVDYETNGMDLTTAEVAVIALLTSGDREAALARAIELRWVTITPEKTTVRREGQEFAAKLPLLGLTAPWD
ncbi:MAG TPA: FAD-dependent thymidylate synthase [Thermomicrobiales bacterium]|nr:FAD-dependent thymidylate synthase [Thermomicrobiales bacterium]